MWLKGKGKAGLLDKPRPHHHPPSQIQGTCSASVLEELVKGSGGDWGVGKGASSFMGE